MTPTSFDFDRKRGWKGKINELLFPAVVLMWRDKMNPPVDLGRFKKTHERLLSDQYIDGAEILSIEYQAKVWQAARQQDGTWPILLADYEAA